MKRLFVGLILTSVVVGGAVIVSPVFATTTGTIHVWSVQNTTATSPIVFTGAFGDYGQATSTDKNGKTDVNGSYVRIVLKKGTFDVNAVALNQEFGKLQPAFSADCSATFTGTAPVTLFGGTGAYKDISGTVKITATSAFVLPRFKNGKCNESEKANPVAQYNTITGSGTVTFG